MGSKERAPCRGKGSLEIRKGARQVARHNRPGTWEIAFVVKQVAPGFVGAEEVQRWKDF